MKPIADTGRHVEKVVLVAVLVGVLFGSPVVYWWAQNDAPWYLAYLLWFAIIVLSAWLSFWRRRNDL